MIFKHHNPTSDKCQTTPSIKALESHQPVIFGDLWSVEQEPFHTGLPDHHI
jgi:hypothetical protein